MPLFTGKDRIAIAILGVIILAGWGVRLAQLRMTHDDHIRVIRNAAVPSPAAADSTVIVTPAPESESAPAGMTFPANPAARIDLNRATAAELEALPMIGPKKAADIIRWRTEHGPFRQTADVMKVKGIGKKTYDRIAPYLTAGESPGR